MSKSIKSVFAVATAVVSASFLSPSANAAIVINEVYGGGGNAGSTFMNDYIELYNNGLTAANISGYQLNYASATGAFTSVAGTDDAFSAIIPTGTSLGVGGFYLIQEAKGAGGTTALPNVNLTDATPIALSSSTFKVVLNDGSGLTLDALGVGPTASSFEGAAPAPIISNTTSASRIVNGIDTNNNSVDFAAGTPTPGASNVIPEPASLAMLGLGAMSMLRRRR